MLLTRNRGGALPGVITDEHNKEYTREIAGRSVRTNTWGEGLGWGRQFPDRTLPKRHMRQEQRQLSRHCPIVCRRCPQTSSGHYCHNSGSLIPSELHIFLSEYRSWARNYTRYIFLLQSIVQIGLTGYYFGWHASLRRGSEFLFEWRATDAHRWLHVLIHACGDKLYVIALILSIMFVNSNPCASPSGLILRYWRTKPVMVHVLWCTCTRNSWQQCVRCGSQSLHCVNTWYTLRSNSLPSPSKQRGRVSGWNYGGLRINDSLLSESFWLNKNCLSTSRKHLVPIEVCIAFLHVKR